MLKKLLGIAPTLTQEGSYSPSPLALRLATSSKTDYDLTDFNPAYAGSKKILMVCTEERNMTMANGKKFSTGNHPVEMLVPMLHLKKAGFDIDIFTPTGESVKIEMWAMPKNDVAVNALYREYEDQFSKPRSLSDFVQSSMLQSDEYIAIFIPGGHGAMIGLPENRDLSNLIHWSHEKLHILSICHGPAALLAADRTGRKEDFIYKGYKMAAFPDAVDSQTPIVGYMPGKMPWKFGEKLERLGVTFVNKKADKTCHVDRKLITGASPQSANGFGKLAATELLKSLRADPLG